MRALRLVAALAVAAGLSGCYQELAIAAALTYQAQHHPHLDVAISVTPSAAHVGDRLHVTIVVTNPSTYFHVAYRAIANTSDATHRTMLGSWVSSSQPELAAGATRRIEFDVPIVDLATTDIGVVVPEDEGRERTFAGYQDDERLHWVPIVMMKDG
jgi:hypothetical protein